MATVNVSSPKFTINAANTYVLGTPMAAGFGTVVVFITNDGTLAGATITVKARPTGTAAAFVPVPYTARYVTSAVGTDASANTALSLDTLILVNAEGQDIALDVTGTVTGSASAYVARVYGR